MVPNKRIGIAQDSAANGFVGRAELGARTGKLGDIYTKFKNKFLKTVIFGKFVVSFVLTARKFGALTVHIREIIMTKNSAQRGKIGETLKYGLLVLCMVLLSACGGGGGASVSLEPAPDNGGESSGSPVTPTNIESQLAAMEREIAKLSEDERAVYESIIEVLRSDLAAKEVSIEDLMAELSAVQQQLLEITALLSTESPCANEQYYVDGSCKNCPPGLEFSFSDSACIASESSCGAIGQVLRNGSCQECQLGTAFSDNECVASESPCTNDQYYVDGSCKNCAAGLEFSFSDSECVASELSCGAIGRVYVDGDCQDCESGLEFSNNECIPTASYCHAQEQVLEGNRCRDCAAGMEFSDDKCIVAESSCEDGQVDTDGSCKNCAAGMERKNGECIPTASYCHAQRQVLEDNSCRDCAVGMAFINDQCVPISYSTVAESEELCNANGMIFNNSSGGFCNSCSPRNPVLEGNKCIATVESCNANDRILFTSKFSNITPYCRECPIDRPRQGNECSSTKVRCVADNKVLVNDVCVSTTATCNAENKILVGDSCESCPEDMRFRDNQCVVRSEFDTAEYRANPGYEDMKVSYAYEKGYFGQGVTVAILGSAGYVIDHPDLAANYITASIAGMSDFRLTATANFNGAARLAGFIGATRNGVGMHGIAPEVKMVPLVGWRKEYGRDVFTSYIRESNIPIIAHGNYGINIHDSDIPVSDFPIATSTVYVYNDPPYFSSLYDYRSPRFLNYSYSARFFNDFVDDNDAIWVSPAAIGGAYAPIIYPRLQTLFVAALGVGENRPQYSNNDCGKAKDWCVAAAVYNNYSTTSTTPSTYRIDGYSRRSVDHYIAAAHVSGALALLYGALGIDSPQLARAILLTTATDLGEPGVDKIYGHGLVNISAGIALIENMKTAAAEGLSAVSFDNLRGELPSGFAHLHNELSAVQVAIKLTNGLHYNVALSEMLTPGDAPDVPLGDGATDMLADAESDSRRGFFAYGDIDAELGLRYYGGTGGFSYVAEGQHAKTNQRFFSGNFGSLGGVSGKVYSGKVGFVRDMNMAGMQIFGDYERAAVGGDGDEGNLIVGVRDAQAESWMAGLSFADIWKYGDKIKLSARQEMGLSGGDLIVRYPHAVGDFHETFIGEGTQEIEVREAFLPLKQSALMIYTAGYAQQFTAKSEWAAALEYNAGNNAKAFSLIWQGEF